MKLYLEVEADTNDADYVSSRTEIAIDQLDRIEPLIKEIGKERYHNFIFGREYLGRGEQYAHDKYSEFEALDEFIESFVPLEEGGIHSITSIKLLYILKEDELL